MTKDELKLMQQFEQFITKDRHETIIRLAAELGDRDERIQRLEGELERVNLIFVQAVKEKDWDKLGKLTINWRS